MPLALPNLDDRTHADLVEEARALISSYDPAWTDHNPSDPGITLIELFAWLVEILIFRANQVPEASYLVFLRLLNGPDWSPPGDLESAFQQTVVRLRERYRAISAADFEQLASEQWLETSDARRFRLRRLRAHCVPRRNLEAAERDRDAPAHISLIVVPEERSNTNRARAPTPGPDLCSALWRFLNERRLVGVRHHVVAPDYVGVEIGATLVLRPDARPEAVELAAGDQLRRYFDPLGGGADGTGWPFGRPVYRAEVYEQLDCVSGVDYVTDVTLGLSGTASEECWRCRKRKTEGMDEVVTEILLKPHELVEATIRDIGCGEAGEAGGHP